MNKKGFTLIELLAVILILGVIVLVAIPTVNKIINQSREGAFKSTVQNIVDEITKECQLAQLKDKTIVSTYVFSEAGVIPELNIKGTLPTSGSITIDSECNVSSVSVSNGKYTANIYGDIIKVVVGELPTLEVGDSVYYNPVQGTLCDNYTESNSVTNVKGDVCMKWYYFKDNSDGTKSYILDHNTTALVAWNSSGSNASMNEVKKELDDLVSVSKWKVTPRLITADEVAVATEHFRLIAQKM